MLNSQASKLQIGPWHLPLPASYSLPPPPPPLPSAPPEAFHASAQQTLGEPSRSFQESRMAVTAPTASADANGSAAAVKARVGAPMATALLTDKYQFSMAYTYWKAGMHAHRAVFYLYFRKNPFGGEFTVFAGLEEYIFIANFKFTEQDISFLQSVMPMCEDVFFDTSPNRATDKSGPWTTVAGSGFRRLPWPPLPTPYSTIAAGARVAFPSRLPSGGRDTPLPSS